jgi:serine/threonine-protein kinase RsbW
MTPDGNVIRLEIRSAFDMLDFVQIVSDRIARMAGLDDESIHWIGVAVRESVINAMKHGHRMNEELPVVVEFMLRPGAAMPSELVVKVIDRGEGFEPQQVADPLAPENILKSSGRGIFFMRSFMDGVDIRRLPEGGMEVTMIKKLQTAK